MLIILGISMILSGGLMLYVHHMFNEDKKKDKSTKKIKNDRWNKY